MKHAKWAATPADRVAQLCRHHGVELGLVTDGRWWTLVWAPRGGVTTTATFDAIPWPGGRRARRAARVRLPAELRDRFFSRPDSERLPALLQASLDNREDITEALGVQVRQAVELLVAAKRARRRQNDRLPGGEPLARLVVSGLDETAGHLLLTPQPAAPLGA